MRNITKLRKGLMLDKHYLEIKKTLSQIEIENKFNPADTNSKRLQCYGIPYPLLKTLNIEALKIAVLEFCYSMRKTRKISTLINIE